jgi:predicted kinase
MPNLIIYRGIPASGKSTAAKLWLLNLPGKRARVNRDDIRLSNFGYHYGMDERIVTEIQDHALRTYLGNGYDVALDNTNLRSRDVRSVLRLAKEFDANVDFRDFPISLEEAIKRDEERARRGGHHVGDAVITDLYHRFTPKGELPPVPRLDEDVEAEFPKYVAPEGRKRCILVDIDGTLAHMVNRGPYDASKYADDAIDNTIRRLVASQVLDHTIIVMSGRDAAFRAVTEEWLAANGVYYDLLYMRPEGDRRKDSIVKNELFETHIAGKYAVDFVLDDRDQVVRMWRAKGLKCLQVAEGKF